MAAPYLHACKIPRMGLSTYNLWFVQRPYKTMNGEPVYTVGKSFMRDVPLSFEHQMENL